MKATESIFSGQTNVIPMAIVQNVERVIRKDRPELSGIFVITEHTKWDNEADRWANAIYLGHYEGKDFLAAWCKYRSEIESETLADLTQQLFNIKG